MKLLSPMMSHPCSLKSPWMKPSTISSITKGTTFTFNGKLYKQVDGCSMGNPLSPTLANIFMCKLKADVVTPLNLPFYNRYVDDCCTKRKANAPDILLENLNSYHPNIKFTVEENPHHFLDTAFTHQEGNFITKVHHKPGKLQVHWKSAIPHKCKRNTILGALHRAKLIATNWQEKYKLSNNLSSDLDIPPNSLMRLLTILKTQRQEMMRRLSLFTGLMKERKLAFNYHSVGEMNLKVRNSCKTNTLNGHLTSISCGKHARSKLSSNSKTKTFTHHT